MASILLNQSGFAVLRVYFTHKENPVVPHLCYYKIDTGANSTTISRSVLNEIGYDDDWIRSGRLLVGDERPTVATGEPVDNCYKVVLPEVKFGIWTGRNWSFLVSLNDKVHFRPLFGTDSMQFFNWNFDYERNVCSYNALVGKRLPLFNQLEQSVHSVDEVSA